MSVTNYLWFKTRAVSRMEQWNKINPLVVEIYIWEFVGQDDDKSGVLLVFSVYVIDVDNIYTSVVFVDYETK